MGWYAVSRPMLGEEEVTVAKIGRDICRDSRRRGKRDGDFLDNGVQSEALYFLEARVSAETRAYTRGLQCFANRMVSIAYFIIILVAETYGVVKSRRFYSLSIPRIRRSAFVCKSDAPTIAWPATANTYTPFRRHAATIPGWARFAGYLRFATCWHVFLVS